MIKVPKYITYQPKIKKKKRKKNRQRKEKYEQVCSAKGEVFSYVQ